ncbi:Kelch-like protein 29, partial [Tetrabaena socialis]
DAAAIQTLVSCGRVLRPLVRTGSHNVLDLGPPLQLYAEPAPCGGQPAAPRHPYDELISPVWDPHSSAVYFIEGFAVFRLNGDNTVTEVAGELQDEGMVQIDGLGRVARFMDPWLLASDGVGALYVADETRIRKLQLPLAEEAGPAQSAAAAAAAAAGGTCTGGDEAAAGHAMVSTLPFELPPNTEFRGLAFDGGSPDVGSSPDGAGGSLLYSTETAVYRLPLGVPQPTAAPALLAGVEGAQGSLDGPGPDARFVHIMGLTVDVLPVSGCLALCGNDTLCLLDLGLKPPRGAASAATRPPAGPLPRTLPGDFGALLDRQPDGTADLASVVGSRTFHVHRLILSARSDYFRQLLGGSFADSGTQQLNLPDADPDIFELLLRFVYAGAVDVPEVQAQAVAELADRLLLPKLCQLAVAVVEASVSTATVVGLLLWAEACGPAFSELLSRLKAWYVEHHEAVLEAAPGTVEQLAADAAAIQTLVACGRELRPLVRTGSRLLDLGPPLQLYAEPAPCGVQPAAPRRPYAPEHHLTSPVWDPHSSAVYILEGCAVLRLSGDNTVTVVAGAVGPARGQADGPGQVARFLCPWLLASDGAGALYVADRFRVRMLQLPLAEEAGPAQSAAAAAAAAAAAGGSILPVSGCLALGSDCDLCLLDLGLKPPRGAAFATRQPAPAGPPPRTLPSDFGALLDRQPDGTADLTIVVGGRTFHVHRLILSARSDYFRQLLGGDFADSGTQQLTLPDADPDAFALLLLFLYTGAVDIPSAQAQAVAELADRLLLPELSQLAQAAVEASVSGATVVGLLLWAGARGPAFSELLSRLKAWYVEHHEAVLEEEPDVVEQLAAASPRLVAELVNSCFRSAKRARAT